MEKKKVTKRIQASKRTQNRRINAILNAMKQGRVTPAETEVSVFETQDTESEHEIGFKKREKGRKKQQIEEITDQIQEENVQQQGKTGENQ